MYFSVEEEALIYILYKETRQELIDEFHNVIPHVANPAVVALMEKTLRKLERITDEEYSVLVFTPLD